MPIRYDASVFINCPFTRDYEPLFHAIVFAVQDCGLIPRCSLERSDGSETRIEKIFHLVEECRFGIHDISATDLDPKNNLPRFNMPFELGVFLGAKKYGSTVQRRKRCLILDHERYRFQKFCSDIAGQDPKAHLGRPQIAIECVRNWLRGELDVRLPGATAMAEKYRKFQNQLPVLCGSFRLEPSKLEFNDLTTVIGQWLGDNPLG